ncbi:MAG: membrane dipeptidase [Gemmatimonadetes bacterium]|nr:membrane dipeptidase [Gemmatimonadota bacterium]
MRRTTIRPRHLAAPSVARRLVVSATALALATVTQLPAQQPAAPTRGTTASPSTARPAASTVARDLASYLPRARRLMKEAPFIDSHNDLPEMLQGRSGGDFSKEDPDGHIARLDTDLPRMVAGGVGGEFFAAFVPAIYDGKGAAKQALLQIDLIHRMTDRSPRLRWATTADDIVRAHKAGRIASLIGVEGGHAIENNLAVLRQFHALGVRYMTLTHGTTIPWADASTDRAVHGGLTPFGKEVVREMNRLGMMVDISHVSDGVMSDVARTSEAPLFFSHSSARALADHPRNVPDSILAIVGRKGGVVMANAYPGFVDPVAAEKMRNVFEVERQLRVKFNGDAAKVDSAFGAYINGPDIPHGTLAQYVDHIEHIIKVAGPGHVGIGADLGSLEIHPAGLEDVSKFPMVVAELLRRGHSEAEVKGIMGGNLLRVMRETEKVAARLQKVRGPSMATIAELDSARVTP